MSKNYLCWQNSDSIAQIKCNLVQGKTVVGSSDTVFGLLANTTKQGFESLNAIKQRADKPYIILIDKIDKLKHFVSDQPAQPVLNLLEFCWPGPLTVVFRAKADLPDYLCSHDRKIAIRVPNHFGLLQLLPNFAGLFSTSANLAGEPVPALARDISPKIMDKVDLLILDQYNIEDANAIIPSTILDCSGSDIKLIRAGAYNLTRLEQVCGTKILV